MQENILVEVIGDTPNIKLLGFLLENPFDGYNISEINRFTGIAKDTVKKYLHLFELKQMVCCTKEKRPHYKINIDNPYVKRIEKNMFEFIEINDEPRKEHIIYEESGKPYFNYYNPLTNMIREKLAGA